jgi:eudesmane-5,11-diol synthase
MHADVFDKFRDGTGKFSQSLSNDVRGLLSLYNAAHMATPFEEILDQAIVFTRQHLEAAKAKLRPPMSEQVTRALDIPLPRFMPRLEAVHYISEYQQEEGHDTEILELARLDYALLNSLHLKELRDLTLYV